MNISLQDLRYAAEMSQYAYSDTPKRGTLHVWDNAAVVLHEEKDILWIAIRGTDDLQDLFEDVSVFRSSVWGMDIHEGFFRYTTKVWDALSEVPAYHNAVHRNKEINITGHSLGGIAAIMLPLIDPNLINAKISHIITFGSPRGFNGDTVPVRHPFFGRILRIVRPMDLVPDIPLWREMRTPFAAPLGHWTHIGNELYLRKGRLTEEGPSRLLNWSIRVGRYVVHLPLYAAKWGVRRLFGTTRPQSLIEQDHSMQLYRDEIESL